MKIRSIEPTPNPNSMKLNMDETVPPAARLSFTRDSVAGAPAYLRRLLGVEGVRSVYQVADFIALERYPGANWQRVLAGVREALAMAPGAAGDLPAASVPGRVEVFVQLLRGIPMQIKLVAGDREVRVALPERFRAAAMKVAEVSPNLLAERGWKERGVRYGDLAEIGEEAAAEISGAYDGQRLERLLHQALNQAPGEAVPADPLPPEVVAQRLSDPDWRRRYGALDQMEPDLEALTVIVRALSDPYPAVRRLAVVYLGSIGGPQVLGHLFRALKDPSGAVRRAAGDCLSDLADPAATGPMAAALSDSSKLVRWRAARFLYELGDASALPALRAARNDPEFEVSLQVRMAIERIAQGRDAVEPVWKQMTRLVDPK